MPTENMLNKIPKDKMDLDPLYVIFEQHLLNFPEADLDRNTFIVNVIKDYFSYLRRMNVTVPKALEQPIIEELGQQVKIMLVKKIYGCLSIKDFQKTAPTQVRKRARTRYSKLTRAKPRPLKDAG